MSKSESWYAQLTGLAGRYGEDVVRAAEQHLGAHLAQRPSEEQLAAIEHLAALHAALGGWEPVERMAHAIASGRPPHVATEPQRAAIAFVPGTGRRGGRGAVVLIEVMSPTAGYTTLATRCHDAIALSPKGRRTLEAAGIRYVHELVRKPVDELGRIDGLPAEDLAAIIRFCDRFGLPLGSNLDRMVIDRVEEMIGAKK